MATKGEAERTAGIHTEGDSPYIMIDEPWAKDLRNFLEDNGVPTWLDQGVRGTGVPVAVLNFGRPEDVDKAQPLIQKWNSMKT